MEPPEVMADVREALRGAFLVVLVGAVLFSLGLAAGYFMAEADGCGAATAAGPEPVP